MPAPSLSSPFQVLKQHVSHSPVPVSAGQPSFPCPCPCPSGAQLTAGSPWPLLNGIGLRTVLLSQVTITEDHMSLPVV